MNVWSLEITLKEMYLIRCLKDGNLIFSIDFCLYFLPNLCLVMKQSSKRDIIFVRLNRQNTWTLLLVLCFKDLINQLTQNALCFPFRSISFETIYCIC